MMEKRFVLYVLGGAWLIVSILLWWAGWHTIAALMSPAYSAAPDAAKNTMLINAILETVGGVFFIVGGAAALKVFTAHECNAGLASWLDRC
jgi:uncharacterized membrane protein